jgi:6-pyruvoyltetrahydropterin/6-carboxytetrahydropterin synthase
VVLRAPKLDPVGFVKDYRELDGIKRWIDNNLDHRHLNDVLDFNPTAENLAEYLYNKFTTLLHPPTSAAQPDYVLEAVVVAETEKTWAEYVPEEYER